MRERLRVALEAGAKRPVAVVGAFHVSALLEPEAAASRHEVPATARRASRAGASASKPAEVVTSLVPYTFELLDSRTGYPAGIRDPQWQQAVWRANGSPKAIGERLTGATVRICREMRRNGHPAGIADAREAVRLASDL